MISNHLSLVEQQRQHVDSISERTAQFLAAGEDAEHELLEEPKWAHLERGDSSIRIK